MQQEKLDEPKPLPDDTNIENESNEITSEVNENRLQTTDDELCTQSIRAQNETSHPSTSTELTSDIVDINDALSSEDTKQKQKFNESTPSNRKTFIKKELFSKRLLNYGSNSVTPPSKRQLFTPANGASAISPSKRMKFTLTAIHERLFGKEPNKSHYAESDALALLKCAVASKMEFIEYAEENAILFKDIKPIGL